MFGTSRNLFNMFHVVCQLVYRIYRAKSCFILRVSNPFLCEYLLKKVENLSCGEEDGKKHRTLPFTILCPCKKKLFLFSDHHHDWWETSQDYDLYFYWHGKFEMVDVKIYSNPRAQSFTLNDVFVTVRIVVLHIDTIQCIPDDDGPFLSFYRKRVFKMNSKSRHRP